MLVLISDTHLTDGSSGETINSDAFAIFRKQLSNLAYAASFRADHSYRPIERLHLVLLGDILDVIRSSGWLTNGSTVRPWTDVGNPAFAQKVGAITQTILKHNAGSLAILKSLSRDQRVTVPKTAKPQVTASGERVMVLGDPVPVEVLTYYQVGNHDWFYHLPGPAFDAIRSAIVDAMGLVNDPNEPFPYDPPEFAALATAYRQHSVWARHGDLYDPFNFEGDRNASSLGDAIVVRC